MTTFCYWLAGPAIVLASASVAQEEPTRPLTDSQAVQQLAERAEQQAEQAAQLADQLRSAPPAQTPEILRQAEREGVGLAWFSRMRITERPLGSGVDESATLEERNETVGLLQKQAEVLEAFAATLEGMRAKVGTPEEVIGALRTVSVPQAAMIAFGAGGAPNPDASSSAAAPASERNAVELFVAGSGGSVTNDYPSVGAIVIERRESPTSPLRQLVLCTGTLVSARIVVTAGHCVTPEHRGGRPVAVFFQHAGRFAVSNQERHGQYRLAPGDQLMNDLAVLQLETAVTTIRPATVMPLGGFRPGESGTIVGFGFRNALDEQGVAVPGSQLIRRTGLKLDGTVETGLCSAIAGLTVTDPRICWEFKGSRPNSASVCSGDSGGPLFIRRGDDWFLAGVTSFGFPGNNIDPCPPASVAVDVDLSAHLTWLREQIARFDPATVSWGSTALHPVQNTGRLILEDYELLNPGLTTSARVIPVTSGAEVLSVGINGTDFRAQTALSLISPQGTTVCQGNEFQSLVHCIARQPEPGKWRVQVTGAPQQELQYTGVLF